MQWSGNPLFLQSLGIPSIGVESNPNHSGSHYNIVVWITLLRVDSTILSLDFHSKTKWSLMWLLKEWISSPAHLESTWVYEEFRFLKTDMAMCLELGPALGWSRFILKWNFTYLPWLQYLNVNESLQVSTHFKANLVSFKLISNLTSLHIN